MTDSKTSVENDCVVSMHYVLKNPEGKVIDQSEEGSPLPYLHGHQNIVPGLEKALTGLSVGASKDVVVSPAEGYGESEEQLILHVPKDQLPADLDPQVGVVLGMETEQGHHMPVTIKAVEADHVVLDANHELAGVTLHFSVTIDSVRAASAEELQHGHVHHPGQHDH